MLVYKKGKLSREVIPVTRDNFILRLNHLDTGLSIETPFQKGVNKTGYYKVTKEEDGKFVIFEEFIQSNESKSDLFKKAISFFETKILEGLNEKPENSSPPPPQNEGDKPETYSKIPEVGQIVEVKGEYGRVVDVEGTKVKITTLTKDEAMRILREEKNQLIQEAQTQNSLRDTIDESESLDDLLENLSGSDTSIIMDEGGKISSFKVFDADDVKITIFEVKPPRDYPPVGGNGGGGAGEQEPQPDNVKDPLEEPPPKSDDSKDKGDDDSKDKGDDDSKDKGDDDSKDKGDDDSKDKGEDDSKDKGDDDSKGKGEDDSKDKGDDKSKDKGDDKSKKEEDEFGDDKTEIDFKKLLENIEKEIEKGEKLEDIKIKNDISAIEKALQTTKARIKKQFRTKRLAKIGIGNQQVFNEDNIERIDKALNKIFE